MNHSLRAEPSARPLIQLDNITIRINDRNLFENTSWTMNTGQRWAITGSNGSGKSIFIQALCRKVPLARGQIHYFFDGEDRSRSYLHKGEIIVISPGNHQGFMKQYSGYHQARWQSFEDRGIPTVAEFLESQRVGQISSFDTMPVRIGEANGNNRRDHVTALLGIDYLLERKILHLSHGESRKVQIAAALIQSPRVLVLDDPFLGLDDSSRETMGRTVTDMLDAETPCLLWVTTRPDEIPAGISHVLYLEQNRIKMLGEKRIIYPRVFRTQTDQSSRDVLIPPPAADSERSPAPSSLVRLKNVSITYGKVPVLKSINWEMKKNEHWAILGPNGSGKTTLLSLILADNPQSYANDIFLFGKKRGSGESIWDIKERIGFVSPELHLFYPSNISCLEVVCSGFFNSIGLYRHCSSRQLDIAKTFMASLAIDRISNRLLNQVSTGEQRLVLLARAMVKKPELLVLDEPCQGLDDGHQHHFLQQLDCLCRQDASICMILTTHRRDALPGEITHILRLNQGRIQEKGTRRQVLAT